MDTIDHLSVQTDGHHHFQFHPEIPIIECLICQSLSLIASEYNFHSLEVVDRVSETQLQVGENSNRNGQQFSLKFPFLKHNIPHIEPCLILIKHVFTCAIGITFIIRIRISPLIIFH